MDGLIEELEAQLGFEESKDLTGDWTEEYREGYVDGLQQAIDVLKKAQP